MGEEGCAEEFGFALEAEGGAAVGVLFGGRCMLAIVDLK